MEVMNRRSRKYGNLLYIQVRGVGYDKVEADGMGLEKVINFTGMGGRGVMDGILMDLLEQETVGGESGRVGFVEVMERVVMREDEMLGMKVKDGVLTVASVLLFRDDMSMNLYILGNVGVYMGSDVMYGLMN